MDLALHAGMTTGEKMAKAIASIVSPPPAGRELKFGFPNEHMMGSGAYRAHWEGKLEIGISPKYDFFVWRNDDPYRRNPTPVAVTRVNCDGLLHALAQIHHLLDEFNIPLTQRGNIDELPTHDQ